MKISCSSQSLDRRFMAKTMDLPGFIRYAAETLRIPCVEIEDKHFEGTSAEYLKGIRAEVERCRISVAASWSISWAITPSCGPTRRNMPRYTMPRRPKPSASGTILGATRFGPRLRTAGAGRPTHSVRSWTAASGPARSPAPAAQWDGVLPLYHVREAWSGLALWSAWALLRLLHVARLNPVGGVEYNGQRLPWPAPIAFVLLLVGDQNHPRLYPFVQAPPRE